MRIVLDTNVLARAALPTSGLARELLMRCTKSPHVVVLSEFILSEVSRVLRYPRMQKAHGLTDHEIEEYVADLKSACITVLLPDEPPPAIVAADPNDDPILATAIAGQAAVLCSLDRHLHRPEVVAYCRARGIEVMTDAVLIDRLRESGEQAEDL
jgi:putative PIN family toxin of toxin-antitoxin system